MKLPGDLSVFQLLDARLNMLGSRQRVIAENVANVNTPGYVPRDIDQASFRRSLSQHASPTSTSFQMSVTSAGHMAGKGIPTSSVRVERTPDSEVTMDGNAVVVEEQILKIAEVRADFDTAMSLYQKGLSLIRTAARAPN